MTITRSQARPGPSGGYRDRILHVHATPAANGDLASLSRSAPADTTQDVRGTQDSGAHSVTGARPFTWDLGPATWQRAWEAWVDR